MTKNDAKKYDFKLIFKYISTIISWTFFALLSIIGILLIYYFISSRLYATRGEKYEPAFSVYTIVSGSMEPTINVYDIKINDVITFTSTNATTAGMTITHRVIGIKELDDKSLCYVTRGDNNTSEDPSCVVSKNVIGKVSAVIPQLGRIQFFLASKFGWLCIIVLPALYIIIKDLIKLFKFSRKNKEEDYKVSEKDNINEAFKNNKYNKKNKSKYEELIKDDIIKEKETQKDDLKLKLKERNEVSSIKKEEDYEVSKKDNIKDEINKEKESLEDELKPKFKDNYEDYFDKDEDNFDTVIVDDNDDEKFDLPKLEDEVKRNFTQMKS